MAIKIKFDELPKETQLDPIEKGIYYIQIKDIIEDNEFCHPRLVMTHDILGKNRKITYDNFNLYTDSGEPNHFGRKKLRAITEAAKIEVEVITTVVLQKLLTNKIIKAEIETNSKGYPAICFANFYPEDSEHPTLNEKVNESAGDVQAPEGNALEDIDIDI